MSVCLPCRVRLRRPPGAVGFLSLLTLCVSLSPPVSPALPPLHERDLPLLTASLCMRYLPGIHGTPHPALPLETVKNRGRTAHPSPGATPGPSGLNCFPRGPGAAPSPPPVYSAPRPGRCPWGWLLGTQLPLWYVPWATFGLSRGPARPRVAPGVRCPQAGGKRWWEHARWGYRVGQGAVYILAPGEREHANFSARASQSLTRPCPAPALRTPCCCP